MKPTCRRSSTRQLIRLRRIAASSVLLIAAVMPSIAAATPLVLGFESVTPRDTALGSSYWVSNPGFETQGTTFSGGDFFGFVVSASTITGTGGYFYEQKFGASSAAAEVSAESNAGAGGGIGGGRFAVVSDAAVFGFDSSVIDLPVGYRPASVHATNVATTAWLLANSDPNGFAHPMNENGQQFSVTFRGWSQSGGQGLQLGSTTLVLGSYSGGVASIVKAWTLVDLTSLGEAASIDVTFASYDVGEFGINTPTYVALDNLSLVAVPEPSGIVLLAGGAVVAVAARWRFRRRGSLTRAGAPPTRAPRS